MYQNCQYVLSWIPGFASNLPTGTCLTFELRCGYVWLILEGQGNWYLTFWNVRPHLGPQDSDLLQSIPPNPWFTRTPTLLSQPRCKSKGLWPKSYSKCSQMLHDHLATSMAQNQGTKYMSILCIYIYIYTPDLGQSQILDRLAFESCNAFPVNNFEPQISQANGGVSGSLLPAFVRVTICFGG